MIPFAATATALASIRHGSIDQLLPAAPDGEVRTKRRVGPMFSGWKP
jgi:hypothetical protein